MRLTQLSLNRWKITFNFLKIASALPLLWILSLVLSGFWILLWASQENYKLAVSGARFANTLALSQVPDIKLTYQILKLADSTQLLSQEFSKLQPAFLQQDQLDLKHLLPILKEIEAEISNFTLTWNHTKLSLIKPLLSQKIASSQTNLEIKQLLESNLATLKLLNQFLSTPGEYLFLFQNADEIRATGGFLGSYAKVSYQDGVLSTPVIKDIYEQSGESTHTITAPDGVEMYLSGGENLQLQDANWSADYPTSAITILDFFTSNNHKNLNGVVAVNTELIKDILTITEPVYLPDFKITATSQNFTELARADRESFFPGSKQKTIFLNHFFTQLKAVLSNANSQQTLQIANLLLQNKRKYLLIYHTDPKIQQQIEATAFSGSIKIDPEINPENDSAISPETVFETDLFLYPVESNVGINKANKAVTRTYNLNIDQAQSTLKINFTNNNSPASELNKIENPYLAQSNHLHYVNYQRLLLEPSFKVLSITQDSKNITDWSEEIITTHDGIELKEVGFLVTVLEESTSEVTITVAHPEQLPKSSQLMFKFQPGLPASTLTLSTKKSTQVLEFDTDFSSKIQL
jgi:hypothetical protein